MSRKLALVLVALLAFAGVTAAPASAVSIAGAKRQIRKLLIRNYYVEYGSMALDGCAYRGSRNRVQCGFYFEGTEGYASACGTIRIVYNTRGYRYLWRTFAVDSPCGE